MTETWRDGNSVELLINGEQFFPRVFNSIRAARREVLIETFILYEDEVGWALQRALIAAAKRGVRVELTVDDFGSAGLAKNYITPMVEAGVKVHMFDPKPRVLGVRLNIFRRLHRKIVVIDGVLGFIGGINYCVDHLVKNDPMAMQDYAVQVRGPIVGDMHKACLDMLAFGLTKQKRRKNRSPKQSSVTSVQSEPTGKVRALLTLRDNNHNKHNIERHYLRAIRAAKSRIVIANAYFFPGYRMLHALRNAARRGVEVTLILQGQPDMPWVSLLSGFLYGYLIRDGVSISEYCERPLHGKVALVDDEWVTVGSSNLDPLSLALNLEANLIFKDRNFNQLLYKHLLQLTQSQCKPVTMKKARIGYWWRMPFIFLSFHFLRYFPAIAGWLPAHAPELELVRSKKAVEPGKT